MNLVLIYLIFGLAYTHSASTNGYKAYKGYQVFVVRGDKSKIESLLNYMKQYDEAVHHHWQNRNAYIMVAPQLIDTFKLNLEERKLDSSLLYGDFSKIINAERLSKLKSKGFSWTSYYDIDDINNYLRNVSKTYPDIAEVVVGGKSYEGREILGLRINTQKDKDSGKPAFFIESGIHAREWIAPATTTYFINQLLTSDDPAISGLKDKFDWYIFPVFNPDGYHYTFTYDRMWRKTRSPTKNGCYGADPNRNWDHNWMTQGSSSNPCDYQIYAGSEPFSEIETRSLAKYISTIENLLFYVGFHSNAQMLLVPYSDLTEHLDNYDDLVSIGNTSLEYGYKVNGAKYDGPGTAAELLYPASGGSMDWVRQNLSTPLVYTYELRGVGFHWPPNKIPEQGDEVTQMILGLAVGAGELGYY